MNSPRNVDIVNMAFANTEAKCEQQFYSTFERKIKINHTMESLTGRNVALLVLCLCAGYALVVADGDKEIPATKLGQNIAPTMTFLYW